MANMRLSMRKIEEVLRPQKLAYAKHRLLKVVGFPEAPSETVLTGSKEQG
jgi:hypothetical protein